MDAGVNKDFFADKMIGNTQEKLTLMAIMAHPADTFDHCGGTLCHHAERGDNVSVVGVLQGIRVHDEVISDKLRVSGGEYTKEQEAAIKVDRNKAKYKEVYEACAILGIKDVRLLGIEDKINLVNEPNILMIAKLIREVRPDIIFTHYPCANYGIGQHAQVGHMVVQAMLYAGSIDFDDPNPGHRTPQMFFTLPDNYGTKASVLDGESTCYCDLLIDVSDVADKMTRASNCMVSQQYNSNYARKAVETSFGHYGQTARTAYAEPFISYYPETRYYAPLSRRRKEWTNEPEKLSLERRGVLIATSADLNKKD